MGDASWTVDADAAEFDWVARLTGTGLERDDALRRLHALMVRAARQQLRRMSGGAAVGGARAEEIVQSSADEAVVSVLARLGDFEGRSRFTTWAYKFALLQTATTVRREVWNRREVRIDSIPEPVSVLDEPSEFAEQDALKTALRRGIADALTPHQQRVLIGIAVEGVPIDVIAQRTNSTRNAVYKTLHDARRRLRAHLAAQGFTEAIETKEATR